MVTLNIVGGTNLFHHPPARGRRPRLEWRHL